MLLLHVLMLGWMMLVHGQWTNKPTVYLGDTPYQYIPVHNMSTALRIQRDIAMNVTLDQFMWPALDISSAFLGNQSLLGLPHLPLSMGYKRLMMNIYYNPILSDWQLCPQIECKNIRLSHFIKAVDDYLISTQLNGASTHTDIISLIFHLNSLTPNLTITTNLASILKEGLSLATNGKSRIYSPLNLTNAHRQMQVKKTWPQWIDLVQNKAQLLLAFGNISSSIILSDIDQQVLFNSLGQISSLNTMDCSRETSWDFVSDQSSAFSYASAMNVTQCGYSPLFTQSQYPGDFSVHDPGHLSDNILSTLWSWDINQPDTQGGNYRCAAMKENGRWVASDCGESLKTACYSEERNDWFIVNETTNYDRSMTQCPENYVFDVPRVARQNWELYKVMQGANITGKIWLNLNLVYNQDMCWAIGRYGTCWWSKDAGMEYLGLIKTSIVSGVIVLLLVGIFTWVKCARLWRNRNSRSRKAMVKAMLAKREYVTIPA